MAERKSKPCDLGEHHLHLVVTRKCLACERFIVLSGEAAPIGAYFTQGQARAHADRLSGEHDARCSPHNLLALVIDPVDDLGEPPGARHVAVL